MVEIAKRIKEDDVDGFVLPDADMLSSDEVFLILIYFKNIKLNILKRKKSQAWASWIIWSISIRLRSLRRNAKG